MALALDKAPNCSQKLPREKSQRIGNPHKSKQREDALSQMGEAALNNRPITGEIRDIAEKDPTIRLKHEKRLFTLRGSLGRALGKKIKRDISSPLIDDDTYKRIEYSHTLVDTKNYLNTKEKK